jgi:hypothetical protein
VALDDPSLLRVWLAHRVDDVRPTVRALVAVAETCNKLGSADVNLLRFDRRGH